MTWCAPRANSFVDKLAIERRSTGSDGMGGTVDSWTIVATDVSASVWAAKGGESVRADRLSSINAFDIVLRQTSDFTIAASDRLRDLRSGVIYSVKWVGSLDQDRGHLLIVATAGEPHDG